MAKLTLTPIERQIPHIAPWLAQVHKGLMAAALLIMAAYVVIYTAFAINLMLFPFDYDQGEGFELVDTIMFSQGQWPYQDTEVYPFYSSNYPPLFHVMAAPFVWVFGPAYWYGRLLGFLGTLVTASAIGIAVYRDGKNKWIALLAGMAFLASNTIYHIGPLFRQHMTMVMFETLAVVVLANVNEITQPIKRRRTMAIGLALILAAGYTKQLAIATALGALVFLFIRQPKRAVIWGLGFAVVGIGLFMTIDAVTGGQWWLQTITANVNDFIEAQTVGLFRLWFSLHGFLLVPAILFALYELYFDRLSIYTVWFAAAAANSVLSGKWGAGDSYFATAIAGVCILSGLFASRTLRGGWQFRKNYLSRWFIQPLKLLSKPTQLVALIIIPMLYIGYGRAVLHMPTDGPVFGPIAQILGIRPNAHGNFYDSAGRIAGGYADIGHFTTESDIEAGWEIVERVKATDRPIIAEDAAFALLAGKDVVTNPTQLLNLYNNGLFEGDALVGMIENQDFGLIILRAQFYPSHILEVMDKAYEENETITMNGFAYRLLVPDPNWQLVTTE